MWIKNIKLFQKSPKKAAQRTSIEDLTAEVAKKIIAEMGLPYHPEHTRDFQWGVSNGDPSFSKYRYRKRLTDAGLIQSSLDSNINEAKKKLAKLRREYQKKRDDFGDQQKAKTDFSGLKDEDFD